MEEIHTDEKIYWTPISPVETVNIVKKKKYKFKKRKVYFYFEKLNY